ncbi:MAG: type II CRISPR-associated endonuclease Cas1 [Muribaculaceae bacterium]|nr:type II CRISPR-associated endonuclease Cas1 [Muribaculaceae bacterium]
MVVRGDEITKIHLGEISTVLIESTAVSITTGLLSELAKKKIKVIFCDEKRNPVSELVNYYGSHDTSNKVRMQIQWGQNIKEAVWTEIVTEKIRKQKELLEYLGKEESGLLAGYLKEIRWNDESNREGHAAKVYFNALFGLDFTRTADNHINAALNYGYSIILSAFTREVVANGYITQLGLFHDNIFNQFNLASDLMEPFRILIDKEVVNMGLGQFEHEEKMRIVNIMNHEIKIDGKIQYVNNAIKIYCKSVFDALNENDSSLIRFYKIEL